MAQVPKLCPSWLDLVVVTAPSPPSPVPLALLVGTVLVGAGAPAQAQPPPTLRELAAAQGLHLGAAVAGPPTLADPTYREVRPASSRWAPPRTT
ncbi:MAG: hypothetical protein R2699_00765 [Acidimicrobiales bacterium]